MVRRNYDRALRGCHAQFLRTVVPSQIDGDRGLRARLGRAAQAMEQKMFKRSMTLVAVLAVTACTPFWAKKDDGTSRGWFSPSTAVVEETVQPAGAESYLTNCATCHGATGIGDGPHASDLPLAPPDLTQLAAGNAGVFPAETVMATIHGYPGKFHRGTMPEFGPELSGPVVEWRAPSGTIIMTPKGLMDVVAYVESLQVAPETDELQSDG